MACFALAFYSLPTLGAYSLTHWGWMMHICVSKLPNIGSDNGLSLGRCQTIIWTNAGILLIGPLWTNFSEILIEIPAFSFKKMRLKVSAKWRPFCLSLNVLTRGHLVLWGCDLMATGVHLAGETWRDPPSLLCLIGTPSYDMGLQSGHINWRELTL